jgi:integrase
MTAFSKGVDMPAQNRFQTGYRGVHYIMGTDPEGKPEKIFYIAYRKNGRLITEKAGRAGKDGMTAARASTQRALKIKGKLPTNQERREAEQAAKKAEAERWTIDRLWQEYKSQRPFTRSVKVDDNRYENHLKGPFGAKEPHELVPLDVDRLRINLSKKRSPQTVKHVLAQLRRICRFGAKKGLCAPLPFSIEMPKVDNQVTEDVTPEQLQRLLAAIDVNSNIQAKGIMRMALYTGMRANEIFNLQWADLDFERGFIKIRNPKGGRDQTIPMNDAARQLLENHPRVKTKRGKGPESPWVFPGKGGRRRTTLQKPSNEIRDAAGLPEDFRPLHGLRHVFASMMASSGKVDLYTLQRLLTHKSPSMTMRYAHLRDEALKSASNVAGDIITEAAASAKKQGKVVNLADRQ